MRKRELPGPSSTLQGDTPGGEVKWDAESSSFRLHTDVERHLSEAQALQQEIIRTFGSLQKVLPHRKRVKKSRLRIGHRTPPPPPSRAGRAVASFVPTLFT